MTNVEVYGTNDGDNISRQDAIDILDAFQVKVENGEEFSYSWARTRMAELPSAEPYWNEMIVICDCCGHAIHVKRQ